MASSFCSLYEEMCVFCFERQSYKQLKTLIINLYKYPG